MKQHLLITGGCGFIGANLIAKLSEAGGYSVRVLDNESMGKREWISEFDVEFIKGDITNKNQVLDALDGIDAVVHLAADTRVMDSIANPEFNFTSNVVGTFNLLSAMRTVGVERIINASTGGAILGEVLPPVNEEMVPQPMSAYGASKLACEGYCGAFAGSYGFAATSLRFSNVYGPRSFHKGSVVAHFFKNIINDKPLTIYGDGSQTRDYIFVNDLVMGIKDAIQAEKAGIFQLGTGIPTSINKLIATMKKILGNSYNIVVDYQDFRPGEIRHTYCAIDRARRELNYAASTNLEDGLVKTWHWFEMNKDVFSDK